MWRLQFPLFLMLLAGKYFFTFVHLLFFYAAGKKLIVLNLILTLCIFVLLWLGWWLPSSAAVTLPTLPINLYRHDRVKPVLHTIEVTGLSDLAQEYEEKSAQKSFITQGEYINLAILNYAAGNSEKAGKFLELARSLDPNQEFFGE